VVTEWFETFKKDDYARSGNTVNEDFILPEGTFITPSSLARALLWLSCPSVRLRDANATQPSSSAGPIMLGEEPAPHSLEPQFRRLGLSTYLVRGVPTLKAPHTVCKAGDTLNANQVQILKLFMKQMATVRLRFPPPYRTSLSMFAVLMMLVMLGRCSSRLCRNLGCS
jgi:mRNA turnover protein 4